MPTVKACRRPWSRFQPERAHRSLIAVAARGRWWRCESMTQDADICPECGHLLEGCPMPGVGIAPSCEAGVVRRRCRLVGQGEKPVLRRLVDRGRRGHYGLGLVATTSLVIAGTVLVSRLGHPSDPAASGAKPSAWIAPVGESIQCRFGRRPCRSCGMDEWARPIRCGRLPDPRRRVSRESADAPRPAPPWRPSSPCRRW